MARPRLDKLAQAKWRSSGLTDKHAKKLGLRYTQAQDLSKKFYDVGCLYIPYWDLDGKPSKFYRVRYLEKLPGAAGAAEKPQRYDQLPVLQEAYYPPLLDQSWREISKDAKISLAITEGELKAASACAVKIPTLALGGVHSFRSAKNNLAFLPSLEEFDWSGRVIYIVFDNDITGKIDVMRAQQELAQALTDRGAKVYFANIPPGPAKGLDDFIVKHGVRKTQKILEKAEPHQQAQALWRLNEEVVLIKKIDVVIERETSLMMEPNKFMNHLYANRFHMEQVEKGSGNNKHYTMEKIQTAPKWVEWEQRAVLWDLTYAPGQPKVVNGLDNPGGAWNTWVGWGVKPKRGDVGPWHWLLDFLFANDAKARTYFERWCAYPIQYPGAKLYTASVLWSRVKRLGKSMLGLALAKIYGDNATFVESRQLKSEFNTWAKNRQLVVGEEITAGEARLDADYLKYIITHPTFTIRDLYVPAYQIPNHTNFLFLSNHPDAMFLEDGDKRYLIHGITQESPAERSKYEWCDRWLHGSGPSHLMDYFLNLNLKSFNPREHAPETSSKYEMIVRGKTDTGLWVMRLQEDPQTALKPMGEKISKECDLFTPEQLYHAFDPQGRAVGRSSIASLGRHLASAGFRQVNGGSPVLTGTGLHRLYAVRNVVRWEQSPRKEVRDHFDSFFGPKQAGVVK